MGALEREKVKVCASKDADRHGARQGIEEAQAEGEDVAREGEEIYTQSHALAYARSHASAFGDEHEDGGVPHKEEEGHVSETELLIAHVLAAMKDCSLFGKEDKSSLSTRMSKAVTQTSSQECARSWTSTAACAASQMKVATQTSSSASTSSSSAHTSSQVKGAAWTSSQTEMEASDAHMATQTSSQARMFARSSSQENAAALCIASLKHTHNKENYVPSNRTLDMQDERAQPKFRNLADLYK